MEEGCLQGPSVEQEELGLKPLVVLSPVSLFPAAPALVFLSPVAPVPAVPTSAAPTSVVVQPLLEMDHSTLGGGGLHSLRLQ